MQKAIFLDRDGTVNVDKNYLIKTEEFEFEKGVVSSLKKLYDEGWLLIIVTNQSGIARGYFTEKDVTTLHLYINEKCKENGFEIANFYYCPHHKNGKVDKYSKECMCRKPERGMIDKALNDFNIDLENSFVIGDKHSDIQLGKNCGCKTILVGTGYGAETKEKYNDYDYFCTDFYEVFDVITRNEKGTD